MPPTPPDAVRIAFRGSLMDATSGGSALDEFVMTLGGVIEHANPITDWQAAMTELASDIRISFADMWVDQVGGNTTETRGLFPQTVRWDEVRVYHLNEAGLTEHLGVSAFGDLRGTNANPSLPPQCALVVSHYAYGESEFNTFGRHGRGRFYLPPLAAALDVGGRLTTTIRDRVANWMDAFLNDLENKFVSDGITGDGFLHLSILGNDGVAQQIVRIRVGRVIDTQRRRRNAIDEEYTDRAIELE